MIERVLHNGVRMPAIGLGTYPLMGDALYQSVSNAYDTGYRLIDTADNYYNEADLGNALNRIYIQGAKREEFFLVTKISDELYHPNELGGGRNKGKYFWKNSPIMQKPNAVHDVVKSKVEDSLQKLKTDYIDLLLMHWPYPDYFEEIWFEMERVYQEGKVRAIGVCNCRERHLERLKKTARIMPMVNQFETSPLNTKEGLLSYCDENKVQVMVYSPLMTLRMLDNYGGYASLLNEICLKYKKTVAQIVLRYDVQRGLIPIPKSSSRERLQQNIDIFDFGLSAEEMKMLSACNINLQTLPESKSCPGL